MYSRASCIGLTYESLGSSARQTERERDRQSAGSAPAVLSTAPPSSISTAEWMADLPAFALPKRVINELVLEYLITGLLSLLVLICAFFPFLSISFKHRERLHSKYNSSLFTQIFSFVM